MKTTSPGDGNQQIVPQTITYATAIHQASGGRKPPDSAPPRIRGLTPPARQWTKNAGRLGYKQSWIILNPRAAMSELPETILQFGSGKFLRGFADLFIH